jgi:hypothetical protein
MVPLWLLLSWMISTAEAASLHECCPKIGIMCCMQVGDRVGLFPFKQQAALCLIAQLAELVHVWELGHHGAAAEDLCATPQHSCALSLANPVIMSLVVAL